MLKPEQAAKQLRTFLDSKAKTARLARIGKLSKEMATVGRALHELDANGKSINDWEKRRVARDAALATLERTPPARRAQLWEALIPGQAELLETMWTLLARAPYC